jgi:hypothetical protein
MRNKVFADKVCKNMFVDDLFKDEMTEGNIFVDKMSVDEMPGQYFRCLLYAR